MNKSFNKLYKELVDITDRLNKYNIQYWLDAGTLLGIYRNNQLISFDGDFDFGLYANKFDIQKLSKAMNSIEYYHWIEKSHIHKIKFLKKPNIKVDFFLFNELNDYYYHEEWNGFFVFKKSCLNILQKFKCNDNYFYIPNNPKLYLEDLYGTDWKTPNPNFKKPRDYKNYICHNITTKKTHQLTSERIKYAKKMGWIENAS